MTGSRAGTGRRVVLTGTFDVRNYGDLLFPLLASHRLAPHGMTLVPASPTSRDTGWRDAMPPRALAEVLDCPDGFDGLLIGGGNIIHNRPVTLADYQMAGVGRHAYPDLWLGASSQARRRGVPVAWNAPGVPYEFAPEDRPTIEAALGAAAYVSVRDDASARLLGLGTSHVVPDTALGLADLWPAATLDADFQALLSRQGAGVTGPFIAVHVKERSLDLPLSDLASKLRDFRSATGRLPILIGIGACHGDDRVTAALAQELPGQCIDLSQPLGLREIASAIAASDGYVGASMHGYVTAAAYSRPGIIVGRPRLAKMAGLLTQLGRPGDEAPGWVAALDRMAQQIDKGGARLPASIAQALDAHWHRTATALAGPPSNARGLGALMPAA